ncbi:hypothetical protein CWE13_10440 [Aliidiomarina shirensis]|uniref:Uncharacterized protein n=1 Tax=Aliidiomarina shirensis TaxID=1048642 RepID=A0A432WQA6_9GAMM|nr:hypothetical protein CWE13_10440 [Aliidiomarina shirensis]
MMKSNSILSKLIYTKALVLLTSAALLLLWIFDVVFSYFNFKTTFFEFIVIVIVFDLVWVIIFVPVDFFIHYKKLKK